MLFIIFSCLFPLWSSTSNISDYHYLKRQLESDFVGSVDGKLSKSFLELPKAEQQVKLKERLRKYCQKVYVVFPTVPLPRGLSMTNANASNLLFFFRHIKEYWINQLLSFEKQGSACGKTPFMLILCVGMILFKLYMNIYSTFFVLQFNMAHFYLHVKIWEVPS